MCALTGERTRGRRVGTCKVDGRDIGAQLIAAGLARDCPRCSHGRYAELESEAAHRLLLPDYGAPAVTPHPSLSSAGSSFSSAS